MTLTEQTLKTLRSIVDSACYDYRKGVPGATVAVVGKDGHELFTHSAGRRGVGSSEDMTPDSVFWIASCTKMITGIACLQLVERGLLRLDDGEQLEGLCPELKTLKVLLKRDGTLGEKKKQITLRMLLSHTAGFGYSFFNERLRDWGFPAGVDEFNGRMEEVITPLLFQPGESWEYGVGVDWAGIALERVTGRKLNDYMRDNILNPLGIKNMSMIPTEEMKSKLAYMNHREHDGTMRPRDHLMRVPLVLSSEEEAGYFNSGGAGMFANPQEYCKILAVLLNDGKCPRTGVEVLKPSTVFEMFSNQVPDLPDFGRQSIPAAKPDLTNPIPELYPVPGDPPQGWGLTFLLSNGGPTGRSRTTGHWTGLANCWWWCDREEGVAGMVATQILPFADAQVLKLWTDVETEVYSGLRAAAADKGDD